MLDIANFNFLEQFMLLFRIITSITALFIIWACFFSFSKGLRKNKPVLMLVDKKNTLNYPILNWENSIGRSRTCDIVLSDPSVSRDHAVILRRDEGWFICDSGSKTGVFVNSKEISERKLVNIGDTVQIGSSKLTLINAQEAQSTKKRITKTKAFMSSFMLMFLTSCVHLSLSIQIAFGTGEFKAYSLIIFVALFLSGWGFYFTSLKVLNRKTFEVENIAFLLSGIGICLISGHSLDFFITQFAGMLVGMGLFIFLIAFMSNVDTATKWYFLFVIATFAVFAANFLFGTEINGAKNWIYIGDISIQPSELIKILFVLVGTSTLDKLQTKKNIGAFIGFTVICMGFLFLMRDFGTSAVFFAGFLVIAFMRSGSIRTIALILTVAVLGVVMILYFRPYVADRFAGWGNIWEHINDSLGYQQTRTLTYIASGGLFGIGLGNGYLHFIAAGESDLVFGMLCEELGLIMGIAVVFAFVVLLLMANADAKKSRSAYYSIAACASIGILVFQSCLNIFGATDIFPLTGVTLPFISAGGTSMISVWGMVAFIKAADERTYALKKLSKRKERKVAKWKQ